MYILFDIWHDPGNYCFPDCFRNMTATQIPSKCLRHTTYLVASRINILMKSDSLTHWLTRSLITLGLAPPNCAWQEAGVAPSNDSLSTTTITGGIWRGVRAQNTHHTSQLLFKSKYHQDHFSIDSIWFWSVIFIIIFECRDRSYSIRIWVEV